MDRTPGSKGNTVLKLLSSVTALLLLAGCASSWPFNRGPDPEAAGTMRSAEPMIKACQARFASWLGARKVVWDGGPTVTRTGTLTTIQIEAQPTAPETIDPVDFRCEFDGDTLTRAEPVA
jgi:hypothetical protein